ncbi:MAG: Uma2 family endonuclease [Planctomycetales bacterium]|nr:Uma2 family endonuclease [Planctomycetales bacterium]
MAALVTDQQLADTLIAQRRATGADRWDEVWEGLYVMAPLPNDEHQQLVSRLTSILEDVIGWKGLGEVRPGVNISDRRDDWTQNYRCPDVAVFLRGTSAENRGTHWFGGPDLAIEIVSPQDRVHEKIPFYAQVGTRELLVVKRDPWELNLYELCDQELRLAGTSTLNSTHGPLVSRVVPWSLQLVPAEPRPRIRIVTQVDAKSWDV